MSKRAMYEVGKVYRLNSSYETTFKCMELAEANSYSEYNAVLQNQDSGWTFTACGTNLYEDGSIDWDFSIMGRFEKVIK